jgi:heme/copper-type cytochrome/quinol oxidase subunit 3
MRPIGVTGIDNRKLGMWIFLSSEVMLFAGFIGSFVNLRAANLVAMTESAALLNRPLGALNTFILITSSFTMAMAVGAMHEDRRGKVKAFLLLTILLGLGFVGVKTVEYGQKFAHHYTPHTDLFFSFYFIMTGLHALHVIVGVFLMLWLLAAVATHRRGVDDVVVENVGLYWHFVDVVWIFLFPLLYLT